MKMLRVLKALLKPKIVETPEESSGMNFLVAGLGNIGAEYASTRHNSGFMVLDAWAQASNVNFMTERYGDIATVSYKGRKFYLLKPSTYMNLSGKSVRYWLGKLGLPLENLIVVCDDINLPFGTVRLRKSGSHVLGQDQDRCRQFLHSRKPGRVCDRRLLRRGEESDARNLRQGDRWNKEYRDNRSGQGDEYPEYPV